MSLITSKKVLTMLQMANKIRRINLNPIYRLVKVLCDNRLKIYFVQICCYNVWVKYDFDILIREQAIICLCMCTPVPWCCTIIIFGEYTFVIDSTLMIIRYDYKPIITENCGDFSISWKFYSFVFIWIYYVQFIIPMKTNFKIHESVCISCSRFSLCEVCDCVNGTSMIQRISNN